MTINAQTKIASILKQQAAALEAIVSISPRFEKLRNPLLRKLMAGRTTLAAASKLGGCTLEDFYRKLEPLGFTIDRRQVGRPEEKKPVPAFLRSLAKDRLVELDVRPEIASGSDPLSTILQRVKSLQPGEVLKVINSFEPAPLIGLLQKKGLESYVDRISEDQVETYFYGAVHPELDEANPQPVTTDWEAVGQKFEAKRQTLDVRSLEMPQPMLAILSALDALPPGWALFVHHKRIPVYLLPELAEKGYDYRIKELPNGEVHLLIFPA